MPVSGTSSPLSARQCGSYSTTSSPAIRLTPARPLAIARSWMVCSRGSSASSVATMSLPHASQWMPWVSQNRFISLAPSTQSRALSEPGL